MDLYSILIRQPFQYRIPEYVKYIGSGLKNMYSVSECITMNVYNQFLL